jgi:hypothetical protein
MGASHENRGIFERGAVSGARGHEIFRAAECCLIYRTSPISTACRQTTHVALRPWWPHSDSAFRNIPVKLPPSHRWMCLLLITESVDDGNSIGKFINHGIRPWTGKFGRRRFSPTPDEPSVWRMRSFVPSLSLFVRCYFRRISTDGCWPCPL